MSIFVSGSDESAGKNRRDNFIFAGWVGPSEDWSRFFVPAWQERVLDGPPPIPYLHMTDMRREEWRNKHSLSRVDADHRIDEACILLDQMATLTPIRIQINAGYFRDEFKETKVVATPTNARKQFASAEFDPDYICFLAYAFVVLNYTVEYHQEADKVDFIVERNGSVTKYIQEFHSQLPHALKYLLKPELSTLVGELIPGNKNLIPLQAADLLGWHCARRLHPEGMSPDDKKRYGRIAYHKGIEKQFTKHEILQMKTALL